MLTTMNQKYGKKRKDQKMTKEDKRNYLMCAAIGVLIIVLLFI